MFPCDNVVVADELRAFSLLSSLASRKYGTREPLKPDVFRYYSINSVVVCKVIYPAFAALSPVLRQRIVLMVKHERF